MTLVSEGKAKEAQRVLADAAARAEAANLKQPAQQAHVYAALVAAAMHDEATAQKEIAEARRLGLEGFPMDRWEITVFALAGQPALARQALAKAMKSVTGTAAERDNALRALNGRILVAENKPLEAIPELKALPGDGYSQIALVEAYRKAGMKAQAAEVRKALFARKDYNFWATSIQIAAFA